MKTLPASRQEAIAGYAAEHTLADTVRWLRAEGLQTSAAALSDFLSWHALKRQCERNAATVETLLVEVARRDGGLSAERVQELGQAFFSALALEQQDAKAWYWTQQLALKRAALALEERKFRRETCELFLRWAEDRRAREIAAGSLSNAEKIERLGALMFGEEWESEERGGE